MKINADLQRLFTATHCRLFAFRAQNGEVIFLPGGFRVCVCVSEYVGECAYVSACVSVHAYVCMCLRACALYICMCVSVSVFIFACA